MATYTTYFCSPENNDDAPAAFRALQTRELLWGNALGFSVVGERGAGLLDDGDQVTPDALADVDVIDGGPHVAGRRGVVRAAVVSAVIVVIAVIVIAVVTA